MENDDLLTIKVLPSVEQKEMEQFKLEITHALESSFLNAKNIVILCIGTDRSTGDAFGPIVGSLLKNAGFHFPVFGTMETPVDALNLKKYISFIEQTFINPFILTVDASLGKKEQIGSLYFKMGSMEPGKAANKKLPQVGDAHICAIVNEFESSFFPRKIHETRLHHVYLLANETVKVIMESCNLLTFLRQ